MGRGRRGSRSIRGVEGMLVDRGSLVNVGIDEELVDSVIVIVNNGESKSSRIRSLYELGLEVGEIGKVVGCSYNMCYNVLVGSFGEIRKKRSGKSKKSRIIGLWKEGKEIREISEIVGSIYNYCWKVIDEFERSEEKE